MLNKLTAFSWNTLIEAGDHIICAVSGGADSMALLWSLYLLKDKFGIRLSAAHFNHHLRGAESDADEAFVREFCDRFEIPLYVGSGEVKPGHKGLEAAARDARYGFFSTLDGKIATAHTADDNAETVLMHLVRGTGLKGLGGITPMRRGNVIRPMLTVTRQEVLALLEEYAIAYRQDSSNETDDFLRNRLRHHVIPLLELENPRFAENVSDMALTLRQDEAALEYLSKSDQDMPVSELARMPHALRRRWLKAFLERNGVKEPERSHILLAESLVFSERPSARAHFPGGVTIERCYDGLRRVSNEALPESLYIPGPGEYHWGNWHLTVEQATEMTQGTHGFTLAAGEGLCLRQRLSGDGLRMPGGSKSLKKLYIDRKIPASERAHIPVLVDDEGVLAVPGLGVNLDRCPASLPALRFIFRKENET